MANRNIIINYTIRKIFVLAGKSGHVDVPQPRCPHTNGRCVGTNWWDRDKVKVTY